ncbi:unnamed protein product, partial [Prorocentrum cordatum]
PPPQKMTEKGEKDGDAQMTGGGQGSKSDNDGEAKGKGGRGGRRGGRRRGRGRHSDKTLQSSFRLRLASGATIDTLALSAQRRAEALREVGGPVASMAIGLLQSLKECDVGGKARLDIDEYLGQVMPPGEAEPTMARTSIELDAAAIRVETCHDEEIVKLQVAAPAWPMRGTGAALRRAGAAPPGWLEDEMANWLDVLTQ